MDNKVYSLKDLQYSPERLSKLYSFVFQLNDCRLRKVQNKFNDDIFLYSVQPTAEVSNILLKSLNNFLKIKKFKDISTFLAKSNIDIDCSTNVTYKTLLYCRKNEYSSQKNYTIELIKHKTNELKQECKDNIDFL